MSLLEELKEKLQTVCAEQDEQLAKIRVHEAFLGAAMQDIRDLSRAIAALEPSAVEGSSVAAYFDARRAEALLDHQPEADAPEFASEQGEAADTRSCTCHPLDRPETCQHKYALNECLKAAYHTITAAPPIPEGFTPWSGGECPLSWGTPVEVLFRDGDARTAPHPHASSFGRGDANWHHENGVTNGDIIAYRIIEPSPQPEPLVPLAEAVLQTLPGGVEESRDQSDERIEDVSQATDPDRVDRVEWVDLLLENQPGVSSQASSTEAAPANIPTNEGQNPWEPIRYCVDGMVIKRDTEFMCSDGVIRQRRIDGEVGFLELRMETFNEFEGEKTLAYRFTHSRDWKPAIDWAPYFGLTPPTHYGYRLETRWHEGGNQYRYVPTDQFIAHEGDWQDISKLDREELNDALLEGTAGRLGFGDGVGAGVMADAVLVSADTREAGVVAADISDAERTIESVGPVGADVPEDERDETWAPPPGYTYIPTQGERCVCVNLMQDGIGNFFCCNQRGETSADAERTSDESQAETAIEQTLITDDIPSIPREEIPIGSAVETYTDSGIETVKISGTTYVVDDEPERQAETQPQAAYAPVNEDEARMWSNGFEADAKSKAETEQDKRPFWTRAPKPKVNA